MTQQEEKKSLTSWLIMLVLAVVWGASFYLMKKGLVAFSPPQVASLRITFSFLTLLPFAIFHIRKVPRNKFIWIFLVAVFGSGIPPYLFTFGLVKLDSGFEGILNSLTPLFTMLIGMILFRHEKRGLQIGGVLIGLTGAVILVVANSDFNHLGDLKFAFGVVIATISYGLSSNLLKSKLHDLDAITISSTVFSLIVPFALIILFSTDFVHVMKTNEQATNALLHIIVLAVFGTALSLIAYNYLIQKNSALWASTVTYLIPVFALILGIGDGESFHAVYLIGMTFILTGVYLSR